MSQTTVLPVDADILSTFGPAQFSNLRRDTNRHLMVRWINNDLAHRAGNDVDRSTVFYDAQGDFLSALPASTWSHVISKEGLLPDVLHAFYQIGARYYSIGLK